MMESINFKCLIWILVYGNLLCLTIATATPKDHAEILNKLKNDFRDIRHTNQYAALYVPTPNAIHGRVQYAPRSPQISTGSVITPEVDNGNRNRYPQNYAGSTVDINGAVYGNMLNRTIGGTIHTEDLSLNLVFPGLQNWYEGHFGQPVRDVYLYTHFLPCPWCFKIIRDFLGTGNMRLYVGYTDLFGGMRESGNANLERDTRRRRDDIQNFLNNNRGLLLQVADRGVCHQTSIGRRIRRNTNVICEKTDKMLVIAMEFTSGKAQVWFNGFDNTDYYGWVALLDKNGKRLTWKWTWSKSTAKITFNTNIQIGQYVQYWSTKTTMIRHSYPWKDCGFGYTKLNKLPYNTHNPPTYAHIKLTMKDGYLTVQIMKSGYYTPNPWDWVMIQTLDQITTHSYKTWQWMSKFKQESNYEYCQFSLGYKYAEGFRAKYVFYDGSNYRYEGIYDNSSPIWTPGGCQGGA